MFVRQFYEAVEIVDVHLHLPQVRMGRFADLEIDQHVGFPEQVLGPGDDLALRRQLTNTVLVAAEGQPFVKAGVKMAFEFWQVPAAGGSFKLIEPAFIGIVDGNQKDIPGPAQLEWGWTAARRAERIISLISEISTFTPSPPGLDAREEAMTRSFYNGCLAACSPRALSRSRR